MILSILIPTIIERQEVFIEALHSLNIQAKDYNKDIKLIEILTECDNKEISIGKKRNNLLNKSKGEYIVFFDDDDKPSPNYIKNIMDILLYNAPDCIGFKVLMTTNGLNPQSMEYSLKNKLDGWKVNYKGFDYIRNVCHLNPVKRSLAMKVMFKDIRYGEDKIYSDIITNLCKTECYIDDVMFEYRYSDTIPHKNKYGIK